MDSAAVMISTSPAQPCRPASRIIRPSRGSSGSRASFRPTSVSRDAAAARRERAEFFEQADAVGDVA